MAAASVSVSDLFWFGNPTPAAALADSAFLWLTIDGTPQSLSDLANLGFVFGTHPVERVDSGPSDRQHSVGT